MIRWVVMHIDSGAYSGITNHAVDTCSVEQMRLKAMRNK